MRVYTVHLGPAAALGREVALVKEGFSWPAYLFTILWALVKGMWVTAILLFLVQACLSGAAMSFRAAPQASALASLALLFLIGAFGNDLRRFELSRRGFREIGVVAAGSLGAAEQRAFERLPELRA
jgi:hypothetical protein